MPAHDETVVEAIASVKDSSKLQLLVSLYSLGGNAKTTEMRSFAILHGVRAAKNWNVSQMLSQMERSGWVSKHGPTWEMRNKGELALRDRLNEIEQLESKSELSSSTSDQVDFDLSETLEKLPDGATKAFMHEVLLCLSAGANKAAIVVCWAGAMSRLQDQSLRDFPKEMDRAAKTRLTTPKRAHKGISKKSDFEEIKEADQLQLMMDAGMIGKTLKNQLIEKLNLRNACGHPNEVNVDPIIARAHVQFLLLNVFKAT